MKPLSCFLFAALVVTGGCAPSRQSGQANLSQQPALAMEFDQQLDALAEQIAGGLAGNGTIKVAVVEFSDLAGKTSPLGRFMAEELTTRLFRTGKFEIIERQLLDKILAEQKLSASGLLDEQTAQKIGMTLGVEALTTGTVSDLGASIKVNARLIAPRTGAVFAVASVTVPVDKTVESLLPKERRAMSSSAANQFDGPWEVAVVCPPHTDGALAYTYQFKAMVKDSVLHGQYGAEGTPGSLTLRGRIEPDGSATIFAKGLIGDPKYAVDRAPKSSPYSYHVNASFAGAHGSGTRVEARACTLTFDRQ